MQSARRNAAYGAACFHCAQAKCRCVVLLPNEDCERCRRLGRECRRSESSRNRASKKTTTSKEAQLENKIDDLMLLLSSNAQRVPAFGDATAAGSTLPATASLGTIGPSSQEGQEYLRDFRCRRLPHFPFMYIPFRTSAEELRSVRPFLWLCIIAVSTRSTSKQAELYAEIRNIIAQKIVIELEKTLELLLGLLVGNFQVQGRPFLTLFVQLAISLVFDLGLNKAPNELKTIPKYQFSNFQTSPARTSEERRAVLGCYLMSSNVSRFLRRTDTMMWTDYMDECVQRLDEKEEYPTDKVLVLLIKLQRIIEKVHQSPWHRECHSPERSHSVPPPPFYLAALESELEEVRRQVPAAMTKNDVILGALHHTQLVIHEHAVSKGSPLCQDPDFKHLESLYICLTAVKSFFDNFLKAPPATYVDLTAFAFFRLTHVSQILYRLSTLPDAAWRRGMVVEMIDIRQVGSKIADNMSQVVAASGLVCDGPEDVFTRMATLYRIANRNWEVTLREQDANLSSEAQFVGIDGEMADVGEMLDLPQEFWLADMFSTLERQS